MARMSGITYPPNLTEELVTHLITEVKDWQSTHGSLLKLVRTENEHTVLCRPIGVSLFPSLFPKACFEEAVQIQTIYNKLYVAISEDAQWLFDVLQDLIKEDYLASTLWKIHTRVDHEGTVQDLTLGIFRSDYMLDSSYEGPTSMKQVEFNTFSCAGGTHGNRTSEMHRHFQRSGVYDIESSIEALSAAHGAYGPPRGEDLIQTCILIVVQPYNINICDERPIEYGLWESTPPIPAYRVCFGEEILASTSLTASKQLLYHPQGRSSTPLEVSVVYMRAGYDAEEYDDYGYRSRFQLEQSQAIKCPSILCHLATFKKVQQALAMPGALLRFLPPDEAARVARTFAPLYPLDTSQLGLQAREVACDPGAVVDYVLKPSLEGGGHNVYRSDIPCALERIPKDSWHQYILMRLMRPPPLQNILMSHQGVYQGLVISELGIFGACLWRRNSSVGSRESKGLYNEPDLIMNRNAGWSFKTKRQDVNEMSVVKGYGCFDSPLLLDFASST
ncbi:hypothetical protein LTR66_006391 [Elasticomyces elasticus]|nr:hypothetical protein LTR66_006391 [Elasticomyces elasticus]